jgi:hypothetical protein
LKDSRKQIAEWLKSILISNSNVNGLDSNQKTEIGRMD